MEISDMARECARISARIDRLDTKAREEKLKKALKKKSDELCRELGIRPKDGVILRSSSLGGFVRMGR